MKQSVIWGFGVFLLSMAVCQLLTFSYFYHTMRSYLLPMGDGVKILELFVLPATIVFIAMGLFGAAGCILVDKQNMLRAAMIKVGVFVMIIWSALIFTALLRTHPLAFVGFFGENIRQSLSWLTFIQSLVFVAWGLTAYSFSESDLE